jgi:hypothetical protein
MPKSKDSKYIPPHIWDYMHDWKSLHEQGYKLMTNNRPLDQLTHQEIYVMFRYASNVDIKDAGIKHFT